MNMKKIFKNLSLASIILFAVSCENDDFSVANATGGPELLTPQNGSNYNLSPENATSEATTFVWNHADYDIQTAVNYVLQFSLAGNDFTTISELSPVTTRFRTITVEEMNGIMDILDATPFSSNNIDVRIKSYIGNDAESNVMYSNVITISVVPFTNELPQLAVPGNHQGWNPPTAPRIAASAFGETDYEGFIWLDGGYKFLGPDASGAYNWGNTDWGDDGSFSGILAETGESDCTATAGYYRVRANTTTLEYTTDATVWGIVGFATTGNDSGWNQSIPLTYNQESKKWEGIVTLSAGEFKFRANNAWTINLGGDPASMSYDGSNLSVDAGGSYLVKLDLSTPRQYTYELVAQ
jgi:hypothetical protein